MDVISWSYSNPCDNTAIVYMLLGKKESAYMHNHKITAIYIEPLEIP